MTGNNPQLDLVNVNMHTKFGQILSIHFQDIERKRNSDVNQGAITPSKFWEKLRATTQARSCQYCCAYKIWSVSVNSFSRY